MLFKSLAKLYRYDSDAKEFKKLGNGGYKIFYHEEDDLYKIVMRSQPVTEFVPFEEPV